jgi:hypothetical protein
MSGELTPEQIAAWGKKSRAASGVPAKIEDRSVLARLVTLAFAGTDHPDGERPVSRTVKPARARRKAAS